MLAILIAPLATASADELADLERQRRDLNTIEQQVGALREDLAAQRAERTRLLQDLEQSERDVAALARAEHQLGVEITDQQRAIDDLQRQFAAETEVLAREQRDLAELLRAVYAAGRADRLRLLLDQEDVERLSRLFAYYDYINRERLARISSTQARAAGLAGLAAAAEEEAVRLRRLAGHQRETRARLEAARERRGQLLAEVERSIASRAERIAALETDAASLRALIAELEQRGQILAEADLVTEPLAERRGRLPWPVAGRILTHFGAPKDAGRLRWDGVVLAAPEGGAVRAVHPGRVVYADWLRGLGLLVIIDHGDGYMTLYGNNQAILTGAGEWVAGGETIALSGTTGGRGAEGLYFAVRHGRKPLDPERWCSAKASFED
ncbi:murein hydrolase activator EnvC family protein [Thioflavicoccus mobilis]|uniref:murein hydrolase activator EnvC family protein n=1 Tax=Thioflavicoccus mobilis TaxID=80679 RepID=UPI0012FB942C|nr:peptidoglycan DD-metalloendopeptidase family protein [Thioflavicoccus mobilis]